MSEPTIAQLITAYRAKAQEYTDKANALEGDALSIFGAATAAVKKVEANGSRPAYTIRHSPPSMDKIRERVSKGGVRVEKLAQLFNMLPEKMQELIEQPDSQIRDKGRGWLEVVSEDAAKTEERPAQGPLFE